MENVERERGNIGEQFNTGRGKGEGEGCIYWVPLLQRGIGGGGDWE